MTELTLTDTQVSHVREGESRVRVLDKNDDVVGVLIRQQKDELGFLITPELVETLVERMSDPNVEWIPSEVVLSRLGSDEMIARIRNEDQ